MNLYLVDGYGFVFRAYHSLPPLSTADGQPTGAVYGFINMLTKLLEQHKADMIAIVLDSGKKSFRNALYQDYKIHRPEAPEDLVSQFPIIREAIKALNIVSIEHENFEADDIIATYAKTAAEQDINVHVVSSDKDLLQLMNNNIQVIDPVKDKEITYEYVKQRYGVRPDQIIDTLALIGDSSDNVPGVKGIGIKTAAKLLNRYDTLDNIYRDIDNIQPARTKNLLIQGKEDAILSQKLVTLDNQAPATFTLEDLKTNQIDKTALSEFLYKYGFRSLISKLGLKDNNHNPFRNKGYINIEDSYAKVTKEVYSTGIMAIHRNNDYLMISCPENNYRIPIQKSEGSLFTEAEKLHPIEELKALLEDDAIIKVVVNAKEWIKYLLEFSIELRAFEDISVIAYSIETGKAKYDLNGLTVEYLGAPETANSTVILYLYTILKSKLFSYQCVSLYEYIDKPMSKVLAHMEIKGVKIDQEALALLSQEFSTTLLALETEIYRIAGHEFNIASPKQLGEVLFEEMGLPGGKRSKKTNNYSAPLEVLGTLSAQGYNIAEKIQQWRQFAKLISTYTNSLPQYINTGTKRVHTTFSMQSTSTGRLSSHDPNLQNIPIRTEEGNKIRNAFIAGKGYKIISADYSQIELRLLAHVADIEQLKDAIKQGADIHASTASSMFNIPLDQVDPISRRKAKAINFGIIYGISSYGLAKNLNINQDDAAKYIKNYFKQYPGIDKYMTETIDFAKKYSYVETLFGRRCHVKGLHDKKFTMRSFAERAAINAPLQGTAADIIKKAMINLPEEVRKYLMLQIHDELLFEVPEESVNILIPMIKYCMENVVQLSVPLSVEVRSGKSWLEAH